MTQLERIAFIYSLLEKSPQSVNTIHENLLQRKVQTVPRQIYHDIEQMQQCI